MVTRTVTVNPQPAVITGVATVCAGSTTTLSDATPGGTWTSGSTSIATVGGGTGIVAGISAGNATISYTLSSTGCFITRVATVNPQPATITGTLSVCTGSTATVADATAGGTWSILPLTIATIGSSTGTVTGVSAGTATVTYTLSTGCTRTAPVTVNALPVVGAITGTATACVGATGSLFDATPGGTWTSGSTSIATVSTSGVVTGVAVGTATITYTVTNGAGCSAFVTRAVTVNPAPSPITGTGTLCAGAITTLSDVTGGGTWTSGSTAIATVGSTGIVTGVSVGTATISYTIPSTGCVAATIVTVNPLPAPISGTTHVCVSATTTLADGTAGGTWSSSGITTADVGSSTGLVIGVSPGTVTITYALSTGCQVITSLTVNPLPVAGTITGLASVCATATIPLANATSGGVWSSSNTSLATVDAAGVVTGVAAGVDTIMYSVTNICGTAVAIYPVTVNPLPNAGTISGVSLVCMGVPVTLTNTATGGSWSSSSSSIATVGAATGTVIAVAAGSATISYTVTNGCGTANATHPVTVSLQPAAGTITGADSVCEGNVITLSNTTTGGVWSASSANATVGTTGIVTGITAGTDTIKYSVTNACGTAVATHVVIVRSHADCNVGVHSLPLSDAGIKIYPNPTSGSFTVEIPETQGNVTIRVSDVLGKTIETRTVPGSTKNTIFDLGGIATGSYLIQVNTNDKIYRSKVVIW